MQSEKDKWIEDVLASADGIKRASSSQLTKRVMTPSVRPAITQDKETWVNEVMDSTTGVQPATVSHKIDAWQERILNQKNFVLRRPESGSLIWRVAASVTLIIVVNALTVYKIGMGELKKTDHRPLNNLAMEFGLGSIYSNNDPGTVFFGNQTTTNQ